MMLLEKKDVGQAVEFCRIIVFFFDLFVCVCGVFQFVLVYGYFLMFSF